MLKVALFLLTGFVILAAAWFLAGMPGHVVASIGAFTIETSTPVAILMLVALVVVVLIVLRLLRGVLGIPRTGAAWHRRHRLALGERAVTRVLVALAAGEQAAARKEARRARDLLGDLPQNSVAGRRGRQAVRAGGRGRGSLPRAHTPEGCSVSRATRIAAPSSRSPRLARGIGHRQASRSRPSRHCLASSAACRFGAANRKLGRGA